MIKLATKGTQDIDNAYVLWVLCLIDHYRTNNIPLSIAQIEFDFGEKAATSFIYYANEAAARRLLLSDFVLTDRGQIIVDNWKYFHSRIFDLE
jgi:hypothetical protein